MDRNLNIKMVDLHTSLMQSPMWACIKYRLKEYKITQQKYIGNFIRQGEWSAASRLQGQIDSIDEAIKLSEGLGREIKEGTFDVDAALHVIENKVGKQGE
jgi:hypothetical protein